MFRRFADERGRVITPIAEVLGIVASLIGIWQFAASFDLIPVRGPIQIVQDSFEGPTSSPTPFDGPTGIDVPQRLDAPSGLEVSGCLLSWNPVDGAESYRITRDDAPLPSIPDTSIDLSTLLGADGQTHVFRVTAHELGSFDSLPSDAVSADC
jgi:hypothetical protein